jgi:hypothetical protein
MSSNHCSPSRTSAPSWIREQTKEQTDSVVGLTLMRLRELQNARALGDMAAAERAEQALTGVFQLTGDTPRRACERVRQLRERIDATAAEALVPRWPRQVTLFQLMDKWRRFLGHQHLRGSDTGVKATRDQLVGALLACGLSREEAAAQAQALERNSAEAQWFEEGGGARLIRYAILHALAQRDG